MKIRNLSPATVIATIALLFALRLACSRPGTGRPPGAPRPGGEMTSGHFV
jgi:hypothetical protein